LQKKWGREQGPNRRPRKMGIRKRPHERSRREGDQVLIEKLKAVRKKRKRPRKRNPLLRPRPPFPGRTSKKAAALIGKFSSTLEKPGTAQTGADPPCRETVNARSSGDRARRDRRPVPPAPAEMSESRKRQRRRSNTAVSFARGQTYPLQDPAHVRQQELRGQIPQQRPGFPSEELRSVCAVLEPSLFPPAMPVPVPAPGGKPSKKKWQNKKSKARKTATSALNLHSKTADLKTLPSGKRHHRKDERSPRRPMLPTSRSLARRS